MDEVEYSDVMKTESGRGCGLGCDGYRQGDVVASSQGTSGDNDEFCGVFFFQNV